MELGQVEPIRREPRVRKKIDENRVPRRLPQVPRPVNWKPKRIFDFDLECVAAAFGDPDYVPAIITCWAGGVIGEDTIWSEIATNEGIHGPNAKKIRRAMLAALLEQIRLADMLTGHNIIRFDLPLLQAECFNLGLPPLPRKLVQDTIRIKKTRGFKKGQDNLVGLLKVPIPKMHLSFQDWSDAYDEEDWADIRERCVTDVQGHMIMREKMIENRWLREPMMWRPG